MTYDERGNASRVESAGRAVYEIVYDRSFLPRTAAVPADVFVTPNYGDHAVGAAIQVHVAMPQMPRMSESIPLAVDRAYNGQNLHLSI